VSKSEEEIRQARKSLNEFNPMKSRLMANILHEMRTPLHSISGFTKLMLEGRVSNPKTQEEFLTVISEQGEHLRRLIDELIDISSIDSDRFEIRKEHVSIKDLLQKAVDEIYSLAHQKNIVISINIAETLPKIEADSMRLKQVMFNLLNNAIRFSDDGSCVSVKAEVNNGEMLVKIEDQGIGIAEEVMPAIFNRFYQVKDPARVGGLGLGLYISKQIIEAHGGCIWAESINGKGSTFSFTLPLD